MKELTELLEGKGFVVANKDTIPLKPSVNYAYAKTIFKNREILVPLLCRLAVSLNKKEEPVVFHLSKTGKMVIVQQFLKGIINQFLDNLRADGFISDWELTDSQYKITVTTTEEKLRFFRSKWAEEVFRYVIMKTVQMFCNPRKISYKTFQNVELKRIGEDNLFTELDLVVQIQKRFYVFEVKSGPWINIMQWANRERALVDKSELLRNIVCTIYESIPAYIFEPQLLFNLNAIEKQLGELLDEDFPKK